MIITNRTYSAVRSNYKGRKRAKKEAFHSFCSSKSPGTSGHEITAIESLMSPCFQVDDRSLLEQEDTEIEGGGGSAKIKKAKRR